jgi:hypothetical protein
MRKFTRTLLVGVSTVLAMGTLSACSGGSATNASSSTSTPPKTSAAPPAPTPVPQSAKFIADMPAAGGKTMTIGIAVDGDEVAAYACNGIDDEAWFFGNQTDGRIDITGKFRDTLSASFDGADMVGDLTMDGVAYRFTAASVPAPAGMYTGELGGVRASWVVRADGSSIGVQHDSSGRRDNDNRPNPFLLQEKEFREQVRNRRLLQAASQLSAQQIRTERTEINGHEVALVIVNGNFRL